MRRFNSRWVGVFALGTALALTGCDELLEVNNPTQIPLSDVNDLALLEVRVNGVVDLFQNAYDQPHIEFGTFLTDEIITGLNWEGHARVNQRIVSYLEGPTEDVYESFSKALRQAIDLADQIRVWQADDPATWTVVEKTDASDFDPELATALVFAGYSATVMGEAMCQTVISDDPDNPSSTVLEQTEIFDFAVPLLQDALAVATGAGETDLANLARAGLARANLGRGNWAEAITYASAIPAGFEWWMDYVDVDGGRNPMQNVSNGGNFTWGIHPQFTGTHPSFDGTGFAFEDDDVIDAQTDPRIQHALSDRTGHNGLTRLYKIIQGLRFSEYTGETIAPASAACPNCTGSAEGDFEWIANFDTDILLANDVEAQHQMYEAMAMQDIAANEAAILAFVNARRAVGNQAPVALSGQALMAELRNQRGRDLYAGGFRLGDLRRWTRFDPGNGPFDAGSYFVTGQHPNAQWGDYDVWTCFPIPISEYEGNPNLNKPANPNIPTGI